MNVKSTAFKLILGIILTGLIICLAVAVAFAFWIYSWGSYKTFGIGVSKDENLIAIFRAHQTTFGQIQQMATEDAQYGWYFNYPYFEGAELDEAYRQEYEKEPRYSWYFKSPFFDSGRLNEARKKKYTELGSDISPGLMIGMDYDDSIGFCFAGGGTSAIGPSWAKGIKYVPGAHEINGAVYCAEYRIEDATNPPQWQGQVLSNLDHADKLPALTYLRPIGSNWFLYYSRDDN